MITDEQLEHLTFQSAQWYNSVLVQGKRFLDALDASHGQFPWDDKSNIFIPEKMFFISAVSHTVCYLKQLDTELRERGDTSFHPFLEKLVSTAEQDKIKKWRNINEHSLEYLIGKGRFPGEELRTVENGAYKFKIHATTTFVNGDKKIFMIGDVDIYNLLIKFAENQSAILQKIRVIHTALFTSSSTLNFSSNRPAAEI